MCVYHCAHIHTTVINNIAQNSSDICPPDNHHCSDAVYWKEGRYNQNDWLTELRYLQLDTTIGNFRDVLQSQKLNLRQQMQTWKSKPRNSITQNKQETKTGFRYLYDIWCGNESGHLQHGALQPEIMFHPQLCSSWHSEISEVNFQRSCQVEHTCYLEWWHFLYD